MIAVAQFPTLLKFPLGGARQELERVARMFGKAFQSPFQGAFPQEESAVAESNWWDGAVVAYQPKGAASLAASYVNLANPGTNDAAPGTAPTFDTSTGWTFNGSSQYLTTGIVPDSDWSVLVQFTDGQNNGDDHCILGAFQGGANVGFLIQPSLSGGEYQYFNTNAIRLSGAITSGNMAIAGTKAYLNGVQETGTMSAGSLPSLQQYIGALNFNNSAVQLEGCKIQALAYYDYTLDEVEIAVLAAAMAAL